MSRKNPSTDPDALGRRHLRFGWWALLVFVTLGLTLEASRWIGT